jgi:hypothetical protein
MNPLRVFSSVWEKYVLARDRRKKMRAVNVFVAEEIEREFLEYIGCRK